MAYTNVTGSQKFKSTGDMESSDRVWGAILAAGSSSRFGTVKALARCGGLTVIEHVANTLMHGGCQSAFAVVGKPHSTRICQQVPRLRVQPVAEGALPSMLTSFLTALEFARVQGAKTLVVALLDQPHVRPATIASLLTALGNPPPWLEASGGAKWVVPRYLGRCGHPFAVHLDRSGVVRMDKKPPITLRDALCRWGDRVEVDVPDPGVLDDLDTLEDAVRLGIVPMASR